MGWSEFEIHETHETAEMDERQIVAYCIKQLYDANGIFNGQYYEGPLDLSGEWSDQDDFIWVRFPFELAPQPEGGVEYEEEEEYPES